MIGFRQFSNKTIRKADMQEHPTGTERILIVDDDEGIAKLEATMLERLGYAVTPTVNCLDALASFKADPGEFDLVITDMTMPDMTGDAFAKALIAVRPEIPVIICTGFSDRVNEETAEGIGVKGFLMKPVSWSGLAEMVRRVLDEAGDPEVR
jgi:two-component system cell cycle sensor histidine kinase/response regulator CckA